MDSIDSPEIQEFLIQEKQRLIIQETVSKLTDLCWDKCVTGTPGNKFSGSETNCLSQCAQRYLDVNLMIMKRFHQ